MKKGDVVGIFHLHEGMHRVLMVFVRCHALVENGEGVIVIICPEILMHSV